MVSISLFISAQNWLSFLYSGVGRRLPAGRGPLRRLRLLPRVRHRRYRNKLGLRAGKHKNLIQPL